MNRSKLHSYLVAALAALAVVSSVGLVSPSIAQVGVAPANAQREFRKLSALPGQVPFAPDLTGIVVNRTAAIRLGKALFWDMQAGSDSVACGTCHFAAGADNRIVNQLNPGLADVRFPPNGDGTWGGTTSAPGAAPGELSPPNTATLLAGGRVGAANMTIAPTDVPLHQLADEKNRNAAVRYTTNDVIGSSGTFGGTLIDVNTGQPIDNCTPGNSDIFHVNGQQTRRTTPRNTPTVINAGYFTRLFWDGRAAPTFNGEDPFGARSPNAFVVESVGLTGVKVTRLALPNSALASQAVGPPLSAIEASCAGRFFAQVGRKLASLRPLALQDVHAQDSVLGTLRHTTGKGLNLTYSQLLRQAFDSRWYRSSGRYSRVNGQLVTDAKGFTQQELNFSMFFGISVMLYMDTLRSDDTPFDRHMTGVAPWPVDSAEFRGMQLFVGKAGCAECHDGPLFSAAAVTANPPPEPLLPGEVAEPEPPITQELVNRMHTVFESHRPAIYDEGFYNIGVTPTAADLGVGAKDPWGAPLSYSRLFLTRTPFARTLAGQVLLDGVQPNPCLWDAPVTENAPEICNPDYELANIDPAAERLAVDGAFKVPGLRNVGLTAPYFHNGGYPTLESVVKFYARGGNRRGNGSEWDFDDNSGSGKLGRSDPRSTQGVGSNVLGVEEIFEVVEPATPGAIANEVEGLTDAEIRDLVRFMLALTDRRVQCRQAPFDHPAISIPDGHVITGTTGNATDRYFILPAVGAAGLPSASCQTNSGDMFVR